MIPNGSGVRASSTGKSATMQKTPGVFRHLLTAGGPHTDCATRRTLSIKRDGTLHPAVPSPGFLQRCLPSPRRTHNVPRARVPLDTHIPITDVTLANDAPVGGMHPRLIHLTHTLRAMRKRECPLPVCAHAPVQVAFRFRERRHHA